HLDDLDDREQGFTIVEVIVAILVLTVGLLALVTSAALVTRMIGRGQRSAVSAQYAQRRLEMLRVSGCKSQAGGSEVLMRGSWPPRRPIGRSWCAASTRRRSASGAPTARRLRSHVSSNPARVLPHRADDRAGTPGPGVGRRVQGPGQQPAVVPGADADDRPA